MNVGGKARVVSCLARSHGPFLPLCQPHTLTALSLCDPGKGSLAPEVRSDLQLASVFAIGPGPCQAPARPGLLGHHAFARPPDTRWPDSLCAGLGVLCSDLPCRPSPPANSLAPQTLTIWSCQLLSYGSLDNVLGRPAMLLFTRAHGPVTAVLLSFVCPAHSRQWPTARRGSVWPLGASSGNGHQSSLADAQHTDYTAPCSADHVV